MAQLRSWEVDAIHGGRLEDEVFYVGTDDDDYESPAHRQCRYEQVARRYLDGHAPMILTASLRGPFDSASGWSNPWAKAPTSTLTFTSSVGQPTPPQSAIKSIKQRRLGSASPRKPAGRPSESYLPSPESLKQAPIAEEHEEEEEEHPYLEDDELRMVQEWRAGVQDQVSSRQQSQLAGQKRKRSIDTENWLKTIPAKRTHRRKHDERTSNSFGRQLDLNAVSQPELRQVVVKSTSPVISPGPVSPSERQTTNEQQQISPSRELWKRNATKRSEVQSAAKPLSSPTSLRGEILQRRPAHSSPLKNVTTAPRSPASTPCGSPAKPCDVNLDSHCDETLPETVESPTNKAECGVTVPPVASSELNLGTQTIDLPVEMMETVIEREHAIAELDIDQAEGVASTNDVQETALASVVDPTIEDAAQTPVEAAPKATDTSIADCAIEDVELVGESAQSADASSDQKLTEEANSILSILDTSGQHDKPNVCPKSITDDTIAVDLVPTTVTSSAPADDTRQKTCESYTYGLDTDDVHLGDDKSDEEQSADSNSEPSSQSVIETEDQDDYADPNAQLVADLEGTSMFPSSTADQPQPTVDPETVDAVAPENAAASVVDETVGETVVELASAAMAMFLSQSSTSHEGCPPDDALQQSIVMSPQDQLEERSSIEDSMISPETPLPSIEVPIKVEDACSDAIQLEGGGENATREPSAETNFQAHLIELARTAGAILGQPETEVIQVATPSTPSPEPHSASDITESQAEYVLPGAPRPTTPNADSNHSTCMPPPPLPLLPPSTPQPSFQVASFSSFMSPSPIRRRARVSRNGRRSCLSVGSNIQNSFGSTTSRKSVTWASVAEDNHGTRLAIREQSPPPDTLLGDLPTGSSDKFSGHFSAVVRRTDGLRHKFRSMKRRVAVTEAATAAEDLSQVQAPADAMEIVETAAATEPVQMEDAATLQKSTQDTGLEQRDREDLSMEPLDIVEDMFREMGDILQVFNVDAELEQARRVEGVTG